MRRWKTYRGFSIIELLIVIGIIAVLFTILLPSVARARELSRRTACAANLKSIGVAARAFAVDHNGKYPICFSLPFEKVADRKRMPMVISTDHSLMADSAKWQAFGIPLSEWEKYGAYEQVWKCPSSSYDLRKYNQTDPNEAKNWGPILRMDYMYLGGIENKPTVLALSRGRWGILMPAVSVHDSRSDERLLAADGAFVAGSSSWGSRPLQINHPESRDAYRVAYQGVVYADGHVEPTPPEYFPKRLDQDTANYSLLHDNGSTKGYFFWGAVMSYTPGKMKPPPAPPAPPATPSPTNPSSPSNPNNSKPNNPSTTTPTNPNSPTNPNNPTGGPSTTTNLNDPNATTPTNPNVVTPGNPANPGNPSSPTTTTPGNPNNPAPTIVVPVPKTATGLP